MIRHRRPDHFGRFTNRLAGCRACSQAIVIGTLQVERIGEVRGSRVHFQFTFATGMEMLQPMRKKRSRRLVAHPTSRQSPSSDS